MVRFLPQQASWGLLCTLLCGFLQLGCAGDVTEVDAPSVVTSSQLIKDAEGRATFIGSSSYFSGTVIDHYGDGQAIRYRASYVDGFLTGEEAEFRQNGEPVRKCLFSNGQRHGLEIIWHQNGKPKSSTNYLHNLASGECHSWDTNGVKLRTSIYTNGNLRSHCAFHPSGKRKRLTSYEKGKLHGIAMQWHPNGQMEWRTAYVHGLQDGTATGWDDEGQKTYESEWDRGASHGPSKKWHANGIMKSMTLFQNGQKEGEAMGAFANGQLEWQALWKANQLHGVYREWHENGQRKKERLYLNGEKLCEFAWPLAAPPAALERFGYGAKLKWSMEEFAKFRGLDCASVHFAMGAPDKVVGQELVYENIHIEQSSPKKIWHQARLQITGKRVSKISFGEAAATAP